MRMEVADMAGSYWSDDLDTANSSSDAEGEEEPVSNTDRKSAQYSPKYLKKSTMPEPKQELIRKMYKAPPIPEAERAKYRGASSKLAQNLVSSNVAMEAMQRKSKAAPVWRKMADTSTMPTAESFLKSAESEFAEKKKKKLSAAVITPEEPDRKSKALFGHYEDDGLRGDIGGQGKITMTKCVKGKNNYFKVKHDFISFTVSFVSFKVLKFLDHIQFLSTAKRGR